MSSSIPLQVAETIQTASIKRTPSPSHDLNPSTTASEKQPVTVSDSKSSDPRSEKYIYDEEDTIDEEEEDIPYSVIKPAPRRAEFPPLPDLRFEQSYLASIKGAETNSRIAYITIRDQIFLPLLQGTLWSLALLGWRHWNRTAQLSGSSVGARIRRWWYRVNNWPIKETLKDEKLAQDVGDFYQNQSGGFD